MRVSVVIPVYNEAGHLAACLDAIARQTVTPGEVIIIDNNSTDDTVAIARRYPFVRLIHESRQGVVHARNRGFDEAQFPIIGRIDADTIVTPDWVETLERIFDNDQLDAVSGSITYHDVPLRSLVAKIELYFRQRIAKRLGDEVFLYGANMAMRRTAWRRTRTHVCNQSGMHEDFDLAIHAEETGSRIGFDPSLHAFVSLRRVNATFADFVHYVLLSPRTYALHGRTSQRHMYSVIALVVLGYFPIKILYKGYNETTGKFSLLRALFAPTQGRANPATHVE